MSIKANVDLLSGTGILVALIILCSMLLGTAIGKRLMMNKAVEHGCAEYHNTTGQFQWKEMDDE